MSSKLDGLHQLKVHHINFQSLNLTKTNEDDLVEWCMALTFAARLIAYIAILVLIIIIIFMILKYVGDFEDERTMEEVRATETNPLWSRKAMSFTYGTCENDLEAGNCTSSSSSSSSSEELYDGKICVICYDEQRNCFFVPCGHCATCYDCAQRIFNGENKTCPVCRRFIGKVRKLFSP